jgi:hypothetical protein
MILGASGDECGNLLGQEYNRPAREAGVLKKPREATLENPLENVKDVMSKFTLFEPRIVMYLCVRINKINNFYIDGLIK